MKFKVHTPNLLMEIGKNASTKSNSEIIVSLNILKSVLTKLAAVAIEIDDDRLHAVLIQLTLYSMSDPESPDYDAKKVNEYMYKF